jgi:hypothetical protein
MRFLKLSILLFAIVFGFATSSDAAPNDVQVGEARQHYQKGIELFDDQAFDSALIEFKRAYALAPSYVILYNIGVASERLRDFVTAVHSYERFLKDGAASIEPEKARSIKDQIALLQGRIARVRITSNVRGGEVFVDGVSVGKLPLDAPIEVNGGRRKLSVVLSEHMPWERNQEIPGGDTVNIVATLEPVVRVVLAQKSTTRPFPWAGVVTSAAFASAAVFTGVLALNSAEKYDSMVGTIPLGAAALDDQRSKTRTLGAVTDVALAGVLVGAGITVYQLLRTPERDAPMRRGTGSTKVKVSPLGVYGAF